ncbi:hypothetical protein [Weissella cibaria]|uniref:hypothetical protein n=1 Tax=Weissella cibaria TaxID=137591 RepID=UPI001C1FF30B|nr:hypothetical protein [Weissella cibaria]MBU7544728.1 hypothetical protein [Weissella cibaria]MCV3317705.1 hypothetical protein [Weissella cibaria]
MAMRKYSEQDLDELKFYHDYGWPVLLNKRQLSLYAGVSEPFICNVLMRVTAPSLPVLKLSRGWLVARDSFDAFVSEAAARGVQFPKGEYE